MTTKNIASQWCVQANRLAMYRESADSIFWDEHWNRRLESEKFDDASVGDLAHFTAPFLRHLPVSGRIIEAGCGMGKIVMALRARGYDCEGVDYSCKTITAVRRRFNDLPIRVGDVTDLQVPDGYYRGYISLGVMEHDARGPEIFLREACRVLSDKGVMMVSVPFFNPLRRMKFFFGCYRHNPYPDTQFYQYAFRRGEMVSILRKHGFHIAGVYYYGGYEGARADVPLTGRIFCLPRMGWRLARWLQRMSPLVYPVAHMILFACEKV